MQELMVLSAVRCPASQLAICQLFNLTGAEGCFNDAVTIDWLWGKGISNLGIILRNVISKDMKSNSSE